MKGKIDILIKLQKIEAETHKIKVMLDDVPDKIGALDAKINEFEQTMAEESAQLEELRKKYRSNESDMQETVSKIEKNQEQLSSIGTNKEYQALLKGIKELKGKNSRTEDEMLASLDRIEEAEKNIATKQASFSQTKDQIIREKKAMEAEAEKGRKKLASLDKDWYAVSAKIDPALLKKVAMLKEVTGGNAVASVKDYVCQGCYMNIPPQMYNELQHVDAVKFCPYCQRIIYWERA